MPRTAHPPPPCPWQRPSLFRPLSSIIVCLLLSACGTGGFSMKKAEVDTTLLTGAIPAASARSTDPAELSDQATIRNAVSSADIETLAGVVPWANPANGTRGTISDLIETGSPGRLCRTFVTTRENFDGVRMFKGEACMVDAGLWRMQDFQAL